MSKSRFLVIIISIISYIHSNLDELVLKNVSLDYRTVLQKQKFGDNLRTLRLINVRTHEYIFDMKDIQTMASNFSNLATLEILDCNMSDEVIHTLAYHMRRISRFLII